MERIRHTQLNKKETKRRILGKFQSRSAPAYFILAAGLLVGTMILSVLYGAADINWAIVLDSLVRFDEQNTSHLILHDLRFPRIIAAALVGSFLAVSGVILQGLTRNPLASPSIMGVSSGAGLMIAVALALFPQTSRLGMIGWAFSGASLGVFLVFSIGLLSKSRMTPVKLALAGASVSALLQSASVLLALYFNSSREISFWFAGSVAGIASETIQAALLVAVIGLGAAGLLSRSLSLMSLGDEVAKGLGQRTSLIRIIGLLVILLLTGTAVSLSGTIGFIGLVVPHIVKKLIGLDYRWIIPFSALLGAWLLVTADIFARIVNPSYETPVGALTALIGVPFFLMLARKEG